MGVEIFFSIVRISVTTSVLIASLLILTPLLNLRYPAKWRYAVWLLIALRLAVPMTVRLPVMPIELSLPEQLTNLFMPYNGMSPENGQNDHVNEKVTWTEYNSSSGNEDGYYEEETDEIHYMSVQQTEYSDDGTETLSTFKTNTLPTQNVRQEGLISVTDSLAQNGIPDADYLTQGEHVSDLSTVETDANAHPKNENIITLYKSQSTATKIAVIWAAGCAVFMFMQILAYCVFLWRLRRNGRYVDAQDKLNSILHSLGKEMNVRRLPRIVVTDLVKTPSLAGIAVPRLLLPVTAYNPEETEFIIRHELVHYKRRDLWYKLLLMIVRTVHWFNPVVHLMAKRAGKDIELSCDDAVVRDLSIDARHRYGQAILSALPKSKGVKPMLSTQFGSTKKDVKKRLGNLFDLRNKRKGSPALAMITLCAVVVSSITTFGASPVSAAAEDSVVSSGIVAELSNASTGAVVAESQDSSAANFLHLDQQSVQDQQDEYIDLNELIKSSDPFKGRVMAVYANDTSWAEADRFNYANDYERMNKQIEWLDYIRASKEGSFTIVETIPESELTNIDGIQYLYECSEVFREMSQIHDDTFEVMDKMFFYNTGNEGKYYQRTAVMIEGRGFMELYIDFQLSKGVMDVLLIDPDGVIVEKFGWGTYCHSKYEFTGRRGLWSIVTVCEEPYGYVMGSSKITLKKTQFLDPTTAYKRSSGTARLDGDITSPNTTNRIYGYINDFTGGSIKISLQQVESKYGLTVSKNGSWLSSVPTAVTTTLASMKTVSVSKATDTVITATSSDKKISLSATLKPAATEQKQPQATATPQPTMNVKKTVKPFDDVRYLKWFADTKKVYEEGEFNRTDIDTLTFNMDNVFKGSEDIQSKVMENGKNPGLGIRSLHEQGITGKGVNVAIIDQNLLLNHPEFDGKIKAYYDSGCETAEDRGSMHAPAVTSILVGDTIGVAPDAKVYFAAAPSWKGDSEYFAKSLYWIIEQNKKLPANEKIRVVSVSAAPSGNGSPFTKNKNMWDAAVAAANREGILVLDCRSEAHTGIIAPAYYNPSKPEDPFSCTGGFPKSQYIIQSLYKQIGVPTSYRTVAEEYFEGTPSYQYTGQGGLSWGIPYAAGVLALGWQINPALDNDTIVKLLFDTSVRAHDGSKIINPPAFIEAVKKTTENK